MVVLVVAVLHNIMYFHEEITSIREFHTCHSMKSTKAGECHVKDKSKQAYLNQGVKELLV